MGSQFEDDVIFVENQIKVARLRAVHIDTVNSNQQVELLEETERLSEAWQGKLPGSFMSAQAGDWTGRFDRCSCRWLGTKPNGRFSTNRFSIFIFGDKGWFIPSTTHL